MSYSQPQSLSILIRINKLWEVTLKASQTINHNDKERQHSLFNNLLTVVNVNNH
jgi:hypothetical protein